MGFPKVTFRIIDAHECPKFKLSDVFAVTGVALFMHNQTENSFITTAVVHAPEDRESCKILCGDITKIIIEYERADKIPDCMISCSGCTGTIRLEHSLKIPLEESKVSEDNALQLAKYKDMLPSFPFFKNIDPKDINEITKYFKLKSFEKNSIVIRKGDPGGNLYIVASGEVEIINDVGLQIGTLGHGEVFGEMSLICEEDVGATVRAFIPCEILYLENKHFNKILKKYPTLYLYF
ncbi:MAG: cyclic nucleotide-binding domain-containing protein, partial [Desulfobulbaceae bacterium]|nr:cyclic nucleotide-binding domain-containing protein [Desulfobulbaceae bacterium]